MTLHLTAGLGSARKKWTNSVFVGLMYKSHCWQIFLAIGGIFLSEAISLSVLQKSTSYHPIIMNSV